MYLALYRQYRPKVFREVIGQEHITVTLANQIRASKVGHSYLFTGSRGTGKTSTAKIFAAAVNCLSPVDGSPCGVCRICMLQLNPDIIEIDAASNNKVEEIRDLREKVKYQPTVSNYKVYIIDEVHMLTDSAYNALLKTLEEPPRFVVFILATTEPNKIPATILSRCMRFDFRLVPTADIAEHLKGIFLETGKTVTEDAVNLIARLGEGSVRDALSIADMCVSGADGTVDYEYVLKAAGLVDSDKVANLCNHILAGSTPEIFGAIAEFADGGKSMSALSRDMAAYFRDLCVAMSVPDANRVLCLPADRFNALKVAAEHTDFLKAVDCIEVFSALENVFKLQNPRISLEAAAVRAALGGVSTEARLRKLEDSIRDLLKKN